MPEAADLTNVSPFDLQITESLDHWKHIIENEHGGAGQEAARDV